MYLLPFIAILLATTKVEAQVTFLNEGFESTELPPSWSTEIVTGETDWAVSSSYRSEGGRSAYLASGSERVVRLITPEIDFTDANEPVTLSFYLRQQASSSGENDSLKVLYRTSAVTPWNELEVFKSATDGFVFYEIQLLNLTANYQIAFEAYSTGKGGVYIDAVKIEDLPLCAEPNNIYLTEGKQTSVKLNWTFRGNSGTLTDSYQLKVATFEIANIRNTTADFMDEYITTSSNSYPLSGLQPNTRYYVYLRANCTASYKGHSDWIVFSFITPCNPVSIPVQENFDGTVSGLPDCWRVGGSNATLPSVTTDQKYGSAGKSLVLLSQLNGDSYVITPPLTDKADSLEITFRTFATVENTRLQVMLLSDPFDISTAVEVSTITIEKTGVWEEYAVNTVQLGLADDSLYIGLYIYSGVSNKLYVDDVSVHPLPPCLRPDMKPVSGIKNRSVVLDWTENGSATQWLVECVSKNDTLQKVASNVPFTLSGLTGNTDYTARVKSICSEQDSSAYSRTVLFTTKCDSLSSADLPYTEKFDSYTSSTTAVTGFFPECWTTVWCQGTTEAQNPQIYYSNSYANSGNYSFRMYYKSIVALPELGVPVNTLKLKFSMKAGTTYSLVVGIMDNLTDTSTFVPIATYAGLGTGIPINVDLRLNDYAGSGKYIAFKNVHASYSYSYIYLDDVTIEELPACLSPINAYVSSVNTTSSTIGWKDGQNWQLIFKSKSDNKSDTVNVSGATPAYTIPDLIPNTEYTYYIKIRSICSPDSSEVLADTVSFRTRCLPLNSAELPYTENFDGYTNSVTPVTTGFFPDCWTNVWCQGTTAAQNPQIYYSTSYPTSGNYDLRMYYKSIVALPEMTDPVSTLRLKFTMKAATTYSLIVGVMDNLADTSTFVPVATYAGLGTGTANVINAELHFDQYTGTGKYIAFKNIYPSSPSTAYAYVYLDDIKVDTLPACLELKDDSWKTGDVSLNTIDVIMNDSTVTDWDIQYGPSGFVLGEGTMVNVLALDTFQIGGLQSSTMYDIYVRRNCGDDGVGAWTSKKGKGTFQIATSVPYFTGFEADEDRGWTLENGAQTNKWIIDTIARSSGEYGLYISDNDSSNTYSTGIYNSVWAYRTLEFTESANYLVSFNCRVAGETNWDYLRAFLVPRNVDLIAGVDHGIANNADANITPEGWIAVDSGVQMNRKFQWQLMQKEVPVEAGTYNLVFYWRNDINDVFQPGGAIDNVSVTKVICNQPRITASNITKTSADLGWTGNAADYTLKVSTKRIPVSALDTITADVFSGTKTTNTHSLSLSGNSTYYCYVQGICSESNLSRWSELTTFTTPCDTVPVPYSDGFEDDESSRFACWHVFGDGTVLLDESIKYSGFSSVKTSEVLAVSPPLGITDISEYQLTGHAYTTADNAQFIVGVMTDPNDVGTYQPITIVRLPNKNEWNEFVVYFSSLADDPDFAGAKHIVIDVSDNTINFDDINFDVIPDCPKPIQLTASDVTGNSVTLDWESNDEASWQLQLVLNDEIMLDTVVTSHPVTLGNLYEITDYSFTVKAICSANESSSWAIPVPFRTGCGDYLPLPYSNGFDHYTSLISSTGYFPDCWTNVWCQGTTETQNPQVYCGNSTSGDYSLYLYYKTIVALPPVEQTVNNLRLHFTMATTSTAYSLIVGVMDELTDTASFVPVATIPGKASVTTKIDTTILFDGYTGTGKYIAFKNHHASYNYAYVYLDDIRIYEEEPDCVEPSDIKANISWNSASVSWSHAGSAPAFRVQLLKGKAKNSYSPQGVILKDTVVNNTVVHLSGLSGGTEYAVYVRALCSAQDSSYFNAVGFTTQCDPITPEALPYTENFDSYTISVSASTGFFPNCWTNAWVSNTGTNNPQIYYGTSYSVSGNYSFMMYYKAITALPPMDSINKLRIRFKAKSSSEAYSLTVGVMDNLADTASFVPVATIQGKATISELINVNVPFSSYTGSGKYIAFRNNHATYAYSYFYIDNVKVDRIPECKEPVVASTGLEWNSISLKWTQANDAPAYRVKIATQLFEDDMPERGVLKDTLITGTSVYIQGLSAETQYYAYVRAYCSEQDSSDYSEAFGFETPCVPFAETVLPYSENFETYTSSATAVTGVFPDNCWTVVWTNATSASQMPQLYYGTNYSTSGNYSLRMYYKSIVAMQAIEYPVNEQVLKFKTRSASTASNLIVGVMDNLLDTASFVPIATIPGRSGIAIVIDTLIRFTGYTGSGKHIAFKNYHATSTTPTFYIDEVRVEKLPSSCLEPTEVVLEELADTSITVSWNGHRLSSSKWEVKVVRGGVITDSVIVTGTPEYTVTGLIPSTSQSCTLHIRTICSEGDTSQVFIGTLSFKTECSPESLPYITNFDSYTTSKTAATGAMPTCWQNAWTSSATAAYNPQVYYSATYASSGNYSFRMYYKAITALAPVEGPLQNLRLKFKSRSTLTANTLIIGVIENILKPVASFVPVDTIIGNGSTATYEEIDVRFTNYTGNGKYIALKNEHASNAYSYFYIDDLSVSEVPPCVEPLNISWRSVTSTSSTIGWDAEADQDKWEVIATNDSTHISDTTIVTGSPLHTIPALLSSTTYSYTFKVRAVCAVNDSSETTVRTIVFTTDCAPFSTPFSENFNGSTYPPLCWTRYSGLFTGDEMAASDLTAVTAYWVAMTNNYGLESKHSRLNIYGTGRQHWLVSPEINITEGSILSFRLALTDFNNANPIEFPAGQQDDKFMVIISDDAGLTWKKENATVWDNTGSSNVYNEIATTGEKVSIILSEAGYAGKTIRVAFYGESTVAVTGEDNDLHIDDVEVHKYGGERIINEDLCSGYGYVANGFNISKDDLQVGFNTFSYLKEASHAAEVDTVVTLNLNIGSSSLTVIRDTICAGTEYNENGFSGLKKQQKYRNEYTSATGCDSIVELSLKVYQVSSFASHTICEGGNYPFGDRILTQTGIYTDTLPGTFGCDSIATLDLTVIPGEVSVSRDLCEGQSYSLGDTILKTTGIYTRKLTNHLGCDSLVTVDLRVHADVEYETGFMCKGSQQPFEWRDTLLTTAGIYTRETLNPAGCRTTYYLSFTVLEPDTADIIDFVCEGSTYNNHGYVDLVVNSDTTVFENLKAVISGCDSVNRIALIVVAPVYDTLEVTVYVSELPYVWNGNSYNMAGTYGPAYLQSEVTGCDSIATLELTVNTGIGNTLASRPFTVSPNPVQRNEPVIVNHEFTVSERRGLRIELVNSLGQVIRSTDPDSYPIQIKGLDVAGFYLIRIRTGEGTQYHGDLIVK